jgi:hypothetical protein
LVICDHAHTEPTSRGEIVARLRGIRDQDLAQALKVTTFPYDPILTHDAA